MSNSINLFYELTMAEVHQFDSEMDTSIDNSASLLRNSPEVRDESRLNYNQDGSRGEDYSSEDDNREPMKRVKKRIQRLTDSDSEDDKENSPNSDNVEVAVVKNTSPTKLHMDKDSDEDTNIRRFPISNAFKSRIKNLTKIVDSSDSESGVNELASQEQQSLRVKNKRAKLRNKFQGLLKSRSNDAASDSDKGHESSEGSNDESSSSIEKIEQVCLLSNIFSLVKLNRTYITGNTMIGDKHIFNKKKFYLSLILY